LSKIFFSPARYGRREPNNLSSNWIPARRSPALHFSARVTGSAHLGCHQCPQRLHFHTGKNRAFRAARTPIEPHLLHFGLSMTSSTPGGIRTAAMLALF